MTTERVRCTAVFGHGRLDANEASHVVHIRFVGVDLGDVLRAVSVVVGDANDDVVVELAAELHSKLQQRLDVRNPAWRLLVRVWKVDVEAQVPFRDPIGGDARLIDGQTRGQSQVRLPMNSSMRSTARSAMSLKLEAMK